MRISRLKYQQKYKGDNRGPYKIAYSWGVPTRSVTVLYHDKSGGISSKHFQVEDPIYPLADAPDFEEEDRCPWGEPLSHSYCAPINEKELLRVYEEKRRLISKIEQNDHISPSGIFKRRVDFCSNVIERIFLWFDGHNNTTSPELPPLDMDHEDDGNKAEHSLTRDCTMKKVSSERSF